uniref:G protein-coupled receptor n=1 Tax=Haemonchus contortus TaxID=6289 RepID=A0A7I4YPI4_HAECO
MVSIMSAIFMLNFIIRYHRGSLLFHSNLRILYFFLCLCCSSYDIFNIVAKVHHLTVSLLSESPCQIFMPKYLYMAISLPLFFSINGAQFAQISIIAERLAAIIFVRNYESGYRRLGPALVATVVTANMCTICYMYYGETFDAPQWSARALPSTIFPRSSLALLVMLIMNFISLLITIALYFFSRSRRERITLSSKFQSNENAVVSNLLFLISSLQFATLFLSLMLNLYLKSIRQPSTCCIQRKFRSIQLLYADITNSVNRLPYEDETTASQRYRKQNQPRCTYCYFNILTYFAVVCIDHLNVFCCRHDSFYG